MDKSLNLGYSVEHHTSCHLFSKKYSASVLISNTYPHQSRSSSPDVVCYVSRHVFFGCFYIFNIEISIEKTLLLSLNTIAGYFSATIYDKGNYRKMIAPILCYLDFCHLYDVMCLSVHRNAVCQLWIQSADIYNPVQQPYSNQSSGDVGSCQIYSGSFYKLGK